MNKTTAGFFFQPTYKAARSISKAVAEHFQRHISSAATSDESSLAPAPSKEVIEAMVDAGFWTSLRKEEGHSPKISLAYFPPENADRAIFFSEPIPLEPKLLVKIAPGVERAGIHLGVWHNDDGLFVWGTTRRLPGFCFVVEMVEPGLLVIKHRRYSGFGKFVNVAVLKGDDVKIVDEDTAALPDCPALLSSLLDFDSSAPWNNAVNVLIQLATSMRAHGRGGALLLVPSGSERWRGSIIHPINYAVLPSFSGLAELMARTDLEKEQSSWVADLNKEVDTVAGLTAVDGATLINDRYELLAFGAKIRRSENSRQVEQIMFTEPVVGNQMEILFSTEIGGTRHLSAAQFVYDQRDAIALVASQDGKFTVFGWSPCDGRVHAHRIDTLLL